MQRLFSTFPGGLPGIGLLLLRAAAGMTGMTQGALYLTGRSVPNIEAWAMGVGLAGCGVFLLVGFVTPLVSAVLALGSLATAFSWISPPERSIFGSVLPAILVAIIAVAVALLGPGTFSVDFRLFGRREIIIPRNPGSTSSRV